MTVIAPTLQAFFSDRLTKQLNASPRTIASYRDTLSLLLRFVQDATGTAPSALQWDELDEPTIAAFLGHLETNRHNRARTRNLRLTAIISLRDDQGLTPGLRRPPVPPARAAKAL
jgi:site-specific recombinase XerD